ncbi:hypothetical protein [Thermus antranikianii]|nr:hypothetical protein [Thermus antranikianii]
MPGVPGGGRRRIPLLIEQGYALSQEGRVQVLELPGVAGGH